MALLFFIRKEVKNMQNISFDEGFKSFSINGDESRVIRFNPRDLGIITRMEDTLKDFGKIEKQLKNVDGENFSKTLKEVECTIHQKIDEIFNADVHDTIFNHQSPVALVGGEFLFMRVINAIIPIVEKEVKKETEASEKRMKKYTEQYRK